MSITISGTGAITGVSTNYSFDKAVSIAGTVTYEDVTSVDSVGIITAQSGLHVTSGNVKIGTDGPNARLQISGGTSNDHGDGILLSKQGGNIYGIYPSANNLEFKSVTGNTHIATFEYGGDVGIGTNNAEAKLHVKSSGATEIKSESTGDNALVSINNSSSIPWILTQRSDTSHGFSFRYNGNNYVNIDTSGNFGIGTISPNNYSNYSTLTINGTSGGIIDLEANGTIYGELQALSNEFRINAVGASGVLRMYAGASERMRIDSSGNISIGTTSGDNNQSRFFVNNIDSTQHTSVLSKGTFSNNTAVYFEAKGRHAVRNTSEIDIDLVQAIDAFSNIHTIVTFEFLAASAVSDKVAKITGHAGFYRVGGGSFTYYTSTPSITMLNGSGFSAGSLSWVGSGNTKTLRYSTSTGNSYVKFVVTDLKVIGHDYAPAKIL